MLNKSVNHSLFHQKRCTEKARRFFEIHPRKPLVFFLRTRSHKLPFAVRSLVRAEQLLQNLIELEFQSKEIKSTSIVYDQLHLFHWFSIPSAVARQFIHRARKCDHYKFYFQIDPAKRFTQDWIFANNTFDPFN